MGEGSAWRQRTVVGRGLRSRCRWRGTPSCRQSRPSRAEGVGLVREVVEEGLDGGEGAGGGGEVVPGAALVDAYEACLAEDFEVVGDGALGEVEAGLDVADAERLFSRLG